MSPNKITASLDRKVKRREAAIGRWFADRRRHKAQLAAEREAAVERLRKQTREKLIQAKVDKRVKSVVDRKSIMDACPYIEWKIFRAIWPYAAMAIIAAFAWEWFTGDVWGPLSMLVVSNTALIQVIVSSILFVALMMVWAYIAYVRGAAEAVETPFVVVQTTQVADVKIEPGPGMIEELAGLDSAALVVLLAACGGSNELRLWSYVPVWGCPLRDIVVRGMIIHEGDVYVAAEYAQRRSIGPMVILSEWVQITPSLVSMTLPVGHPVDGIYALPGGLWFIVSGGVGYKTPKPNITMKDGRAILCTATKAERVKASPAMQAMLLGGSAIFAEFPVRCDEYNAPMVSQGLSLLPASPVRWLADLEGDLQPSLEQPLYAGPLHRGTQILLGNLTVVVTDA